MTQEQRLDYLVEEFKTDSVQYKNLQTPVDTEGKRRILRSLMNIRMPKQMPERVLEVQDEYLKGRADEKGIVQLTDIPVIKEGISIWQGDITRLAVDAIVNAANSQMLGCFVPMHTCIDNCIHTFAGVQLRAECARRMQQLRIRYGSDYEQPTAMPMLTEAYNLALNNLKSVAFCCISTGVFHFPNARAAEIAVRTVKEWLSAHPGTMDRVIFNVFKEEDRAYYEAELR